jgi:hypothetical protein
VIDLPFGPLVREKQDNLPRERCLQNMEMVTSQVDIVDLCLALIQLIHLLEEG